MMWREIFGCPYIVDHHLDMVDGRLLGVDVIGRLRAIGQTPIHLSLPSHQLVPDIL
jgi:hypothetical protein